MHSSTITEARELDLTGKLHDCIYSDDIFKATFLIVNLCQEGRRRLTRANEKLRLEPALFVAIKHSKSKFVEFLINECNADIEEKLSGTCTFTHAIYMGPVNAPRISPLEFAFHKDYNIFDFLLTSGADPTRLLKDKKVTLCISKNLSVLVSLNALQILYDHGDDFNASDDKGHTPLINSVRSVHHCRFLLEKGVDINAKANNGQTALHFAVERRYADTVKLLLEKGADLHAKNNEGYDPLHLACIKGFEVIMVILMDATKDANRQTESYQLMGANCVHSTEAIWAWKKAITYSLQIQNRTTPVQLATPLGVAVEATSLPELQTISLSPYLFFMQSMVISYKIFGPNHDGFFDSIALIADKLFKLNSFNEWLQMLTFWLHVVHDSSLTRSERPLRVKTMLSSVTGLLMKSNVPASSLSTVHEFMEAVFQVMSKCTKFKEKAIVDIVVWYLMIYFKNHTHTKLQIQRFVRSAIKVMGQCCERTVLIDVLSRWLSESKPSDVSQVVVATSISILLQCGADVNERDENGNNVVHFLLERWWVFRGYGLSDLIRKIAAKFLEYKVHLDTRSNKGITTATCLELFGIKITPPINLMCIAAQVIRKHEIEAHGILPKFLIDFVALH